VSLRSLLVLAPLLAACGPPPPDPFGPPEAFVEQVAEHAFRVARGHLPDLDPAELGAAALRPSSAAWDGLVTDLRDFLEPWLHPEVVPDWRWAPVREACCQVWAHAFEALTGGAPTVELVRLREDTEPATATVRIELWAADGSLAARYLLSLERGEAGWRLRHRPRMPGR
jgi:hypothetical protein